MLTVTVPGHELFDEDRSKFVTTDAFELTLEHSLASLSKWESIWEKPFLTSAEKTPKEQLSYIECMTLTPNVSPEVYTRLSEDNMQAINNHIGAKMTATWFAEEPKKPGPEPIITTEVIYSWMVALNIPFECENWHLARLITLVRVCQEKNAPKKKLTSKQIAERNREINERRRRELGTRG